MKRGQVTVFILLGLIVLVGFVFYSLGSQNASLENTQGSDVVVSFTSYMESCLHKTGTDAVYSTALQGGYYVPPLESAFYFNLEVPYYWDLDHELVPDQNVIEEQLGVFVKDQLETCIENFDFFRSQGYSIERTEIPPFGVDLTQFPDAEVTYDVAVDAQITQNSVDFIMSYPIEVSKGSETLSLETFQTSVPINMKAVLSVVDEAVEIQKQEPNFLPVTGLATLAHENGIRYETANSGENIVFVTFIFAIPNNDDLLFSYANKYDWVEEPEVEVVDPEEVGDLEDE